MEFFFATSFWFLFGPTTSVIILCSKLHQRNFLSSQRLVKRKDYGESISDSLITKDAFASPGVNMMNEID